ncbi:MAG: adenosine deaminase [Propionibacteriaceae bacterium]|jgi:adenosine deaminase|nr:adenosine deaminase [Propionibacteriaceae bacterium]
MDIRTLPKAELHLHIEGTLEPEMTFRLAERNGVELPWASLEELRARYDFGELQDFLDLYYESMAVLRKPQDFYELAMAYLAKAAEDGVRHAEIFFDPQAHIKNGNSLKDVALPLWEAMNDAKEMFGITGGLIMCFLRDLGADAAADLLKQAQAIRPFIIGVGLDSTEVGYPPELFEDVYRAASEMGLHLVAHGGEEGGPEYVWGALKNLHAERIDHGLQSREDAELLKYLAEHHIALTSCPLSNLRLKAIPSLESHPLRTFLDAGIPASVNSDDPAYFGGYLADTFDAITAALKLTDAELVTLCRNSIETSFADDKRKSELLGELDAAGK